MVAWFVMHNFWDLNIWVAGMSLKSFCKLIVADAIMAMAVPGLALLPSKLFFLTEIGLVAHALLLCYVEDRFFNYTNLYYFGYDDDVMYPSYMIVLTTCMGLALARRLVVDHRIGPKSFWILTCLYSSKLVLLFIASKSVLWVTSALFLAISPPLLLYKYLILFFFVYYIFVISFQSSECFIISLHCIINYKKPIHSENICHCLLFRLRIGRRFICLF